MKMFVYNPEGKFYAVFTRLNINSWKEFLREGYTFEYK